MVETLRKPGFKMPQPKPLPTEEQFIAGAKAEAYPPADSLKAVGEPMPKPEELGATEPAAGEGEQSPAAPHAAQRGRRKTAPREPLDAEMIGIYFTPEEANILRQDRVNTRTPVSEIVRRLVCKHFGITYVRRGKKPAKGTIV